MFSFKNVQCSIYENIIKIGDGDEEEWIAYNSSFNRPISALSSKLLFIFKIL